MEKHIKFFDENWKEVPSSDASFMVEIVIEDGKLISHSIFRPSEEE